MVQGADGCTMVTGASDSIVPMTPQPLRFMCSGAVLPLQCFTLGVPTARHPADLCVPLLYTAVVPAGGLLLVALTIMWTVPHIIVPRLDEMPISHFKSLFF